jgi:hypothetical protein
MTNDKSPKIPKNYSCLNCHYNTLNKKDYIKHLTTQKHKNNENTNDTNDKSQKIPTAFQCVCGKVYKHKPSLYNHKKKCNYIESEIKVIKEDATNLSGENIEDRILKDESNVDYKKLLLSLVNDNKDMKNIIFEQQKQIGELLPKIGNTINNTTNNMTKNKFNINVFLNEHCKDAISIEKFIDSIEISLKNLLTTSNKGLGQGITNLIIDNMNKLSLYERPLHCTDKKRETLYIKSDDPGSANSSWKKDNEHEELNLAIRKLSHKQIQSIKEWTDANPNYMSNDLLKDEYIKLITKCSSDINECREKIIKNVCDKVYIDK